MIVWSRVRPIEIKRHFSSSSSYLGNNSLSLSESESLPSLSSSCLWKISFVVVFVGRKPFLVVVRVGKFAFVDVFVSLKNFLFHLCHSRKISFFDVFLSRRLFLTVGKFSFVVVFVSRQLFFVVVFVRDEKLSFVRVGKFSFARVGQFSFFVFFVSWKFFLRRLRVS